MSSKQPNNPAGWLQRIVEKARTVPTNVSVRQGWAQVFGLDPGNLYGILQSIAEFVKLVEEARKAVTNLKGFEHNLYHRPIERLEDVLSHMNLDSSWSSVVASFDENLLYGLSVTNDVLSKFSKEVELDEETLKDLQYQLKELEENLVTSDIPEELMVFLVDQLERMRNALLNYSLFGPGQVREAVENATGAFILHARELGPFWDNPIIKRLISILTILASAVTVYQGGQLLTEGIRKLLSSSN